MSKYVIRTGSKADRVLINVTNGGTKKAPKVFARYARPSEAPEGAKQISFTSLHAAERFRDLLNSLDTTRIAVIGSPTKLERQVLSAKVIPLMRKVAKLNTPVAVAA